MNRQAAEKRAEAMANRRRKTLVVCASCHGHIHTGQPVAPLTQ